MKPIALTFSLAAALLLQGCVTEKSTVADQPSKAGVEPISGIDKAALAAVIGFGSQIGVFYYPDRVDRSQLSEAPARLCAARGARVTEVEDADLHHPDELPGARHLVVRCSG